MLDRDGPGPQNRAVKRAALLLLLLASGAGPAIASAAWGAAERLEVDALVRQGQEVPPPPPPPSDPVEPRFRAARPAVQLSSTEVANIQAAGVEALSTGTAPFVSRVRDEAPALPTSRRTEFLRRAHRSPPAPLAS